MTVTLQTRRKRGWFNFSMRSMLVTMIIVAIPLGWASRRIGIGLRQRRSLVATQQAGWQVEFDHAAADYPDWLRKSLGEDAFRRVTSIYHPWPAMVRDKHLNSLRGFPGVTRLDLDGTKITDAGMASLSSLVHLQELYLERVKITDIGLAELADLDQLEELRLYKTDISDAGLAHLKKLSKLEVLLLDHTQITDAGLVHLQGLRSLRVLALDGTKVTEAGVDELQRKLPQLRISW